MFIFEDFWWTLYKANISIKQSCTNGIHFIKIRLRLLKGTLMQIWKSPYMFVLIQKQYPENFSLLFLRTAELSAREVVDFLKSRLIFNIFCCFKLCKQTFHISHVHISQKVKDVLMWNLKHIIFIWSRRYWQIFKSALVYL